MHAEQFNLLCSSLSSYYSCWLASKHMFQKCKSSIELAFARSCHTKIPTPKTSDFSCWLWLSQGHTCFIYATAYYLTFHTKAMSRHISVKQRKPKMAALFFSQITQKQHQVPVLPQAPSYKSDNTGVAEVQAEQC